MPSLRFFEIGVDGSEGGVAATPVALKLLSSRSGLLKVGIDTQSEVWLCKASKTCSHRNRWLNSLNIGAVQPSYSQQMYLAGSRGVACLELFGQLLQVLRVEEGGLVVHIAVLGLVIAPIVCLVDFIVD